MILQHFQNTIRLLESETTQKWCEWLVSCRKDTYLQLTWIKKHYTHYFPIALEQFYKGKIKLYS